MLSFIVFLSSGKWMNDWSKIQIWLQGILLHNSSLLFSPCKISLSPVVNLSSYNPCGLSPHMPNRRIWAPLRPHTGSDFLRFVLLPSHWEYRIHWKETTKLNGPSVGYPHEPLGRPQHPSVTQKEILLLSYSSIS